MPILCYKQDMPKKIVFTDEMIKDLSLMGDVDFSEKWRINRITIIRRRKELGIRSFNNQHGTKEHIWLASSTDPKGYKEHKWCQKGHWEPVENFGVHSSRWDGLRGFCKTHEQYIAHISYDKNGVDRAKTWRKTDNGKLSLRNTWRKERSKKKEAFIKWDKEDEQYAYNLFDHRCAYCGKPLEFSTLEFDHFIPLALGGKTSPRNMVPCCKSCNHGKGGKFKQEPYAWLIQKYGETIGDSLYKTIKRKLKK